MCKLKFSRTGRLLARIAEGNVLESETFSNRVRDAGGIAADRKRRAHLEKVGEVAEEEGLIGNIGECEKDSLKAGSGPCDGTGQESKGAYADMSLDSGPHGVDIGGIITGG